MKNIICLIVAALLHFNHIDAQPTGSTTYNEIRAILRNNGWSITEERYGTAQQGNTIYSYIPFYSDRKYLIFSFSEDTDVKDVDLYVYEDTGELYASEIENAATASLKFDVYATRTMKVVVKNCRSLTPNYASTLKFIIAYR